ncbi:MAG: thiamine diphosphokinase [Candidatus Promineifilaceae bacterium]
MVLVVAGGRLGVGRWSRDLAAAASRVIAANGGLAHLLRLGRRPDEIIGDLDSIDGSLLDWLRGAEVELIAAPEAKAETDLELALLHAAGRYLLPIRVLAAFGGRLDQTLANFLLLAHPALAGRDVRLLTETEQVWLVAERTEIEGRPGDLVSLLPIGGDVRVRATSGLRWPLQDETLHFGRPRGVSNEMTAGRASVEVLHGALICIHRSPGK